MSKGLAILGAPVMRGGGDPDVIAPTCLVSSAAGDPVYAAFSVTFTFSEDVTGFVIGDITVGNGTASNFVAVSGSVYTADITPTTAGAVTVSVGAGVCTDAVGNPNEVSNTLSRTCGWFVMTVTTTGAATLTLNDLTVSASTTVDWGDSSSNAYTGSGSRTHNYAGAGTWTVTIKQPLNVTGIDLRDAKITSLTGANMAKLVNLTSLRLDGIGAALVWTVNNAAPMPSRLTYLYLSALANLTWNVGSVAGANMPGGITTLTLGSLTGLTWNVGSIAGANMPSGIAWLSLTGVTVTWNVGSVAGANMPSGITHLSLYAVSGLTWNVGSVAGANMPSGIVTLILRDLSGLTWDVGSVAGANMPANCTSITMVSCGTVTIEATDTLPAPLTTFRFENNLSQAAVDAVLAALYLAFPTRTGTGGTIDLVGTGNAAPSGASPGSPECPPTTGWNTAYELVNDSCGVSAKHWASVSLQT